MCDIYYIDKEKGSWVLCSMYSGGVAMWPYNNYIYNGEKKTQPRRGEGEWSCIYVEMPTSLLQRQRLS
jgi:hypothetical protein